MRLLNESFDMGAVPMNSTYGACTVSLYKGTRINVVIREVSVRRLYL